MIANGRTCGPTAGWVDLQTTIKAHLGRSFDVAFTERPGHATELARQAVRTGYGMIVAIGGDGSINEVANGFFDSRSPIRPDAVLGIIPFGTGNDFIRTMGIPRDVAAAVRVLAGGQTRTVDVGEAQFTTLEGAPGRRYFVNIAEFGAGGAVVEQVGRAPSFLNARFKFLWAILRASWRYRNPSVHYSVDEGPLTPAIIRNFVVANGRYFGAGLRPAPDAVPDDGWLDVVCFGDFTALEISLRFAQLMKGTHLKHPKIITHRARRVWATANTSVLLELDGDLVGRLPAGFELISRALRVCVP